MTLAELFKSWDLDPRNLPEVVRLARITHREGNRYSRHRSLRGQEIGRQMKNDARDMITYAKECKRLRKA